MKRVEYTDGNTLERRVMATFDLVGDQVHSTFHDDNFRFEMHVNGIMVDERELRPEDGAPFYEALDGAFVNSSRVSVVVVD